MSERHRPIDPDMLRSKLPSLEQALADRAEMAPPIERYLRFYGLLGVNNGRFHHTIGTLRGGSETVVVQCFQPPTPVATVFMVHGYFDHVGLYRHVVDLLLSLQLTVVALDLPGHGLSSGARASISSFSDYCHAAKAMIQATTEIHVGPLMTLGQSTGGAVAVTLALKEPQTLGMDRLILFAPLVRPYGWKKVKRLHRLCRLFKVSKIARSFVPNSHDPNFFNFLSTKDPLQARYVTEAWVSSLREWERGFNRLPRVETVPLIIQGGQDETVDWGYNLRAIRAHFADTREFILPHARHHLANESSAIRAKWTELIREQVNEWTKSSL